MVYVIWLVPKWAKEAFVGLLNPADRRLTNANENAARPNMVTCWFPLGCLGDVISISNVSGCFALAWCSFKKIHSSFNEIILVSIILYNAFMIWDWHWEGHLYSCVMSEIFGLYLLIRWWARSCLASFLTFFCWNIRLTVATVNTFGYS